MAKKEAQNTEIKKISLPFKDPSSFIGFLNKFRTVDNNVLVILNEDELYVRSYNDTKTIVKVGTTNISSIFEKTSEIEGNLKIGFYNLDKLSKFFNALSVKDDLEFQVGYSRTRDGDDYANWIIVKTGEFEKTIRSIEKSNFKSMPDEAVTKTFATDGYLAKFKFDRVFAKRIQALSDLENHDYIEFNVVDNELYVYGKDFKLKYTGESTVTDDSLSTKVDKKNLSILDNEDYIAYIFDNKVLFITDTEEKSEVVSIALSAPRSKDNDSDIKAIEKKTSPKKEEVVEDDEDDTDLNDIFND